MRRWTLKSVSNSRSAPASFITYPDGYDNLISSVRRYLVLAAVVAAGAQGVIDGATLSIKDLSTDSAAEITAEERRELGIERRMSLNVDEARSAFEKDKVLRDILGGEFVDAYLKVNKVRRTFTNLELEYF